MHTDGHSGNDRNPENILGALEDVQEKDNYLSEENLRAIADRFGVPLSRIYSLATFYKAFSLKPKGKHHICVCTGTPCHVRGSGRIVEEFERLLGVKAGDTTGDGQYSLETVNCIGACALGPVVVKDGEYHGKMTPEKVRGMIKESKK